MLSRSGGEMLDDDVGEAGVGGHGGDELRERFEATGGGANADDGEGEMGGLFGVDGHGLAVGLDGGLGGRFGGLGRCGGVGRGGREFFVHGGGIACFF